MRDEVVYSKLQSLWHSSEQEKNKTVLSKVYILVGKRQDNVWREQVFQGSSVRF